MQYRALVEASVGTAIAVPRAAPPGPGAPPERFDHLWSPYLAALRKQWEQPDHAFALWIVARNAYTLLHRPAQLFGEGPCFPFPKPLALGHPALTEGLLAAPAYLVSKDPIVAYDVALVLTTLLGALAMFLLVRDWTGSAAAGVGAGLLYPYHGAWASLATYPFIVDLSWTLLALRFGERAFETGRARDALAAALCVALQLGTSLYATLVGALVLLPYLAWLVARVGVARLRPAPLLAALALVAAAVWLIAAPYLDLPTADAGRPRFAAAPSGFLPGRFVGWLGFLLAALALLPGDAGARGSRRFVLLASGVLVLWFATAVPLDPYRLLGFLPGVDLVRGPAWLAAGLHLLVSLLAGLGLARVLGRVGERWRPAAVALLLTLVAVDTLWPEWWGERAPSSYAALELRPSDAEIDFFASLAASGERVALLEVPLGRPQQRSRSEARRVLLHAYHHLPTSSCYNSLLPEVTWRVRALAERLPEAEALRELHSLGFTTLVVHGPARLRRRIAAAAGVDGPLVPLRSTRLLSAYAIRP